MAAAGLLAGGCVGGLSTATSKPADVPQNPDYVAWAAFKPGSFTVLHHVTRTSGFAESAVRSAHPPRDTAAYDERSELIALTPQQAEVTVTISAPPQVIRQTIPATAARATTRPATRPAETVTASGVDYDCAVFATRTAQGMAALAATTWVSPRVPGGVVKSHVSRWAGPIHITDDGMLTATHAEQ